MLDLDTNRVLAIAQPHITREGCRDDRSPLRRNRRVEPLKHGRRRGLFTQVVVADRHNGGLTTRFSQGDPYREELPVLAEEVARQVQDSTEALFDVILNRHRDAISP